MRPVVVVLDALLFVLNCRVEPGDGRELTGFGGVGGTVLDGGVAVANVTEVMDVAGAEEGTGGEGVDGSITPLVLLAEHLEARWD